MNLRLPGQYFDAETNSHYNFHRDYRPNQGRYLQSDPIGLEGGWNPFIYASQNNLRYADPIGQAGVAVRCVLHPAACGGAIVTGIAIIWQGCKAILQTIQLGTFSQGSGDENLTSAQIREKAAERKAYKTRCTQPSPKGLDPCEEEKWKLQRNKDCYNMRKAFMQKWHNDNDPAHVDELNRLEIAIKKNIENIKEKCCSDCEK